MLLPARMPCVAPQEQDHLMSSAAVGQVCRGQCLRVAVHRVGTRQHQPMQGVYRALQSRLVQGRVAKTGLPVWVGTGLKKHANELGVTLAASPMQGRATFVVGNVNACSALQQQARHVGTSRRGGEMEWSAAIGIQSIKPSPCITVELQKEDIVINHRIEEAHRRLRVFPRRHTQDFVAPIPVPLAVVCLTPLSKYWGQLAGCLPLSRPGSGMVIEQVTVVPRLQGPASPKV
mmetsp:Transcript_120623/g.300917  ORF Transcript_120623/g.300917 Transcript_120623/m.300917 type:complete len:232 (+) Transcript_120623:1549-2244(+)